MTDQIIELNSVIKKYKNIIADYEKQIKDAKSKMDIAYKALKLLKEERESKQDELFKVEPEIITETMSEKYKDSSMKEAVTDIFINNLTEPLSGQQIYEELKKNGYRSKSKNLLRDVYVFLNKIYKTGHIISTTNGTPKRYRLPMKIKPMTNSEENTMK